MPCQNQRAQSKCWEQMRNPPKPAVPFSLCSTCTLCQCRISRSESWDDKGGDGERFQSKVREWRKPRFLMR
eukprot:2799016-Rhodomonas_salina.2